MSMTYVMAAFPLPVDFSDTTYVITYVILSWWYLRKYDMSYDGVALADFLARSTGLTYVIMFRSELRQVVISYDITAIASIHPR